MPSDKPLIVLVDDDHGPMDYYKQSLELAGFQVQHIDETDEAMRRLQNWPTKEPPALFVIDMMMPYGSYLSAAETDDGLQTGKFLIATCQKQLPATPVVCLTNMRDTKQIPASVKRFAKFELSPSAFAQEIKIMLRSARAALGETNSPEQIQSEHPVK